MSQFKVGDKVRIVAPDYEKICGVVRRISHRYALVVCVAPEGHADEWFCERELEKLPEKEEAARFVVDDQEKRQVEQELTVLKGAIKGAIEVYEVHVQILGSKAKALASAGHIDAAQHEGDLAAAAMTVVAVLKALL